MTQAWVKYSFHSSFRCNISKVSCFLTQFTEVKLEQSFFINPSWNNSVFIWRKTIDRPPLRSHAVRGGGFEKDHRWTWAETLRPPPKAAIGRSLCSFGGQYILGKRQAALTTQEEGAGKLKVFKGKNEQRTHRFAIACYGGWRDGSAKSTDCSLNSDQAPITGGSQLPSAPVPAAEEPSCCDRLFCISFRVQLVPVFFKNGKIIPFKNLCISQYTILSPSFPPPFLPSCSNEYLETRSILTLYWTATL